MTTTVAKQLPYGIPEIKLARLNADDPKALFKAIQDWSNDLSGFLRRISSSINVGSRGGFPDIAGFDHFAPASGAALISTGMSVMILDPPAAIAALTITLPLATFDGQLWRVLSSASITTVTLLAATGQAILKGSISLGGNAGAQGFVFRKANATWYVD